MNTDSIAYRIWPTFQAIHVCSKVTIKRIFFMYFYKHIYSSVVPCTDSHTYKIYHHKCIATALHKEMCISFIPHSVCDRQRILSAWAASVGENVDGVIKCDYDTHNPTTRALALHQRVHRTIPPPNRPSAGISKQLNRVKLCRRIQTEASPPQARLFPKTQLLIQTTLCSHNNSHTKTIWTAIL